MNLLGSGAPSGTDYNDGAYELGHKIKSDVDVAATAIRFYKPDSNTTQRTCTLYSTGGTALATANVTPSSSAGWVTASISYTLLSSVEYFIAYTVPNGAYYRAVTDGLASDIVNGTLRAIAASGVWKSPPGGMPDQSGANDHYCVDIEVDSGASVGTLTAAAGSFTHTGNASAFAGKLTAAAGSFTYTGNPVILPGGSVGTLTAAAGSYAFTGNTAILSVPTPAPPILRSTSFVTNTGASVTAVEPAGAAQNDIILALITSETKVSITDDPVTHGWTQINVKAGASIRHQAYWIRRGAVAPYCLFQWSGITNYAVSLSAWSAAITSGSPIGATNLPAAFGTGTTLNSGAVTTTANDSVIITAGTHNFGAPIGGWTAPSGYTAIDLGGTEAYMGSAYKALNGGTGTSQDPGSMGTTSSDENYAITLELLAASPGGGSTVGTLLAGAGSYTYTGNNATFNAGSIGTLTAAAGGYVFNGAVEELTWADIVGGAEDGYRVKWGTSSGVYTYSQDVGANVLTLTLSGLLPSTTYYWLVVGLLAGAEQTPSAESSFTTLAGRGSAAFKTTQASDLGTFSRTGIASTYRGTIPAAKGPFTFTGKDAGLTLPPNPFLLGNTGPFTLTGNDASYAGTMGAAAGAFTLTGNAALYQASIAAGSGAYALTGNAAALTHVANTSIVMAPGAFTLTGNAAAFVGGVVEARVDSWGRYPWDRYIRRARDRRRKHYKQLSDEIQARIEGRIFDAVKALPRPAQAAILEAAAEQVDQRLTAGYADHLTPYLRQYGVEPQVDFEPALAAVRAAILDAEIARLMDAQQRRRERDARAAQQAEADRVRRLQEEQAAAQAHAAAQAQAEQDEANELVELLSLISDLSTLSGTSLRSRA